MLLLSSLVDLVDAFSCKEQWDAGSRRLRSSLAPGGRASRAPKGDINPNSNPAAHNDPVPPRATVREWKRRREPGSATSPCVIALSHVGMKESRADQGERLGRGIGIGVEDDEGVDL